MKPGDKIRQLFQSHISPALETEGFKFLRSKNQYKKRRGIFDLQISYHLSRRSTLGIVEKFEVYISVFSPKYRKWEQSYYQEERLDRNSFAGHGAEYMENWDPNLMNLGSYDLVKFDPIQSMQQVLQNIQQVALPFFAEFESIPKAIDYLKNPHREKNTHADQYFLQVFDLYLIQNQIAEALAFFQANNHRFEADFEEFDPFEQKKYTARKQTFLSLQT